MRKGPDRWPFEYPGIYLPNFAGVQVEGAVAVTKDGVDVLMARPRELRLLWAGGDKETRTATSPVNSAHLHKRRNS